MPNKMFMMTIDLCNHQDLFMPMNHYVLNTSKDIEEQVKKVAAKDVAPLVRVYLGEVEDVVIDDFYAEYFFEEYECSCDS